MRGGINRRDGFDVLLHLYYTMFTKNQVSQDQWPGDFCNQRAEFIRSSTFTKE